MNSKTIWMRLTLVAVAVTMMFGSTGCAVKKLEAQRDALRQENLELRNELDTTRTAMEAAASQRQELESKSAQLQAELDRKSSTPPPAIAMVRANGFASIEGVQTSESRGRITVRIPGDILFAAGKVTLKSSAKRTLGQLARVIQDDYTGKTVRISGFTDTDPIRNSKWTDNLELSAQRAMAVHRYLQKQGVDPRKLIAAAHGQWHPRRTKAQSRRVEILVALY